MAQVAYLIHKFMHDTKVKLSIHTLNNLLSMLLSANLTWGKDAFYFPFFINEEGGAQKTYSNLTITIFFSPNSHSIDECLLCVGNETERQLVCFDKFLMTLYTISTYADNFISQLSEIAIMVAKRTSLCCATWGLV
mgnify:CR=1 FL=1